MNGIRQLLNTMWLCTGLLALSCVLLAGCQNNDSGTTARTRGHTAITARAPANNVETADQRQRANRRLPSGVPPAALDSEPELPEPPANVWPFAQGAPRTCGTGRYAYGAYYWTDFLYDATGAVGLNVPLYHIATPTGGTFAYPDSDTIAGNGADIFRVGIGEQNGITYWRVDWETMVDPSVPIAAFALDYQPGELFLGQWPGVPNLHAGGIDAVLLVSASGAFLDTGNGPQPVGTVTSDKAAHAIVARVPATALPAPPSGQWKIYLASGLNDGSGHFRTDVLRFAGLPTEPPVFNLAFRSYTQEQPLDNFWLNLNQAVHLTLGDASPFFVTLDWGKLGTTEPPPQVHGFTNRWYVSSVSSDYLQQHYGRHAGVADGPGDIAAVPQFFDRVQPYGIYVPDSYDFDNPQPTRFTLLLHSSTQNHNQFAASGPNLEKDLCEQRHSICLTTLGRGPDGGYKNDAEVDLWDAWHNVARYFDLDPETTVISGYSMGAEATITLMAEYPDVFAVGVVLAGSHVDANGHALPDMANLQWNGYYHAGGLFDELVPYPDARATVDAMQANGFQYTYDLYPLEDHIVWPLKDELYPAFLNATQWLNKTAPATRKQHPGDITYLWNPCSRKPELGVGPVGPWWLGDLKAVGGCDPDHPQHYASIKAHSSGRPERPVNSLKFSQAPVLHLASPSPAIREQQSWVLGKAPPANGLLTLQLKGVARLGVNLKGAGIAARSDKHITGTTDTPVTLILTGLADNTRVVLAGQTTTARNGQITLAVPAGDFAIGFP